MPNSTRETGRDGPNTRGRIVILKDIGYLELAYILGNYIVRII